MKVISSLQLKLKIFRSRCNAVCQSLFLLLSGTLTQILAVMKFSHVTNTFTLGLVHSGAKLSCIVYLHVE